MFLSLSLFSFRSDCIELDFKEIYYLVLNHFYFFHFNTSLRIYTIDGIDHYINGTNISWSIAEQYPSCQAFDLFDYLDKDDVKPKQIFFVLKATKEFGATIQFEERNMKTTRALKFKTLFHSGQAMTISRLSRERRYLFVFGIHQTEEMELFGNCVNYPTKKYLSFEECDDDFVKKEMDLTGLMPFWATKNYSMVTNQRYIIIV